MNRNIFSMHNQSLVREIEGFDRPLAAQEVACSESLDSRMKKGHCEVITSFFESLELPGGFTARDMEEFEALLKQNPAPSVAGVTGTHRLLWLFGLCRYLQPQVIVESGVFRGRSLWHLRHTQPQAKLYAFDLDFKLLAFKDSSIEFHQQDWSEIEVRASSTGDLCYFDDHINNCLRIRQAAERGFKHLVFDDSPTLMHLSSFRYPGIPTARMLLDDDLKEGDVITWKWNDRILEYTHSEKNTHNAREYIKKIVPFPEMRRFTGISAPEHFVYVGLK